MSLNPKYHLLNHNGYAHVIVKPPPPKGVGDLTENTLAVRIRTHNIHVTVNPFPLRQTVFNVTIVFENIASKHSYRSKSLLWSVKLLSEPPWYAPTSPVGASH